MGLLVVKLTRQGIDSMEAKDDSSKISFEFALISEIRKDYDSTFGKAIYSFTEREKIKFASFPLGENYLLRVSIRKEESDHMKIIENIVNIIRDMQYQQQK